MRLVEKKCPNCGAGLKFNENDTSVACEYCNKTYYIEKDEKKSARVDNAHLGDAYRFVNEFGKPIVKAFTVVHLVVVVVALLMFVVIAFITFKSFSNFGFNSNDMYEKFKEEANSFIDENKNGYVTKISQIDKVSLETFHDTSISTLDNYDGSNKNYKISKDWESCGVYLLVSKNSNENILYDVLKHTYKHKKNGKEIVLYAAVKYDDLKLTEDNIVNNDYMGFPNAPSVDLDGDKFEWAYGYESVEVLYNKLVRSQSGEYTIEASEGLYVEK